MKDTIVLLGRAGLSVGLAVSLIATLEDKIGVIVVDSDDVRIERSLSDILLECIPSTVQLPKPPKGIKLYLQRKLSHARLGIAEKHFVYIYTQSAPTLSKGFWDLLA